MSSIVENYLLDSSARATFTMVSREEIMVMKNVTSVQKHMTELRLLLEQERGDLVREKSLTHQRLNATMHESQPDMQMQLAVGGSMAQINCCWEDLSGHIDQKKANARRIIAKLQSIEGFLTKLPALNRAMIQPCYSTICAEADIVIKKITDFMKIQCDEHQSRLSVYFHELATTLQLSS